MLMSAATTLTWDATTSTAKRSEFGPGVIVKKVTKNFLQKVLDNRHKVRYT